MYLPTKIRQIIQISQPAIQYLRAVSEISARSFAETTCRKNFLTGENKSFCGLKQKNDGRHDLCLPSCIGLPTARIFFISLSGRM